MNILWINDGLILDWWWMNDGLMMDKWWMNVE
jgi:hypothetical protein